MLKRHLIPLSLAILITLIAFWSGLTPTDRAVWYAEVMPIFIIFALLVQNIPLLMSLLNGEVTY